MTETPALARGTMKSILAIAVIGMTGLSQSRDASAAMYFACVASGREACFQTANELR